MPIQDCQVNGRKGKRWGSKGKCYVGPGGLRKALRQARAIKASQSVSNEEQYDVVVGRKDLRRRSKKGEGSSKKEQKNVDEKSGNLYLGTRRGRLGAGSANLPAVCTNVLNRTQVVPSNPLKADPTRTATLRRKFQTAIWVRFARLRRKIVDLVAVEDAFGLRMRTQSPFTSNEERDDEDDFDRERHRLLETSNRRSEDFETEDNEEQDDGEDVQRGGGLGDETRGITLQTEGRESSDGSSLRSTNSVSMGSSNGSGDIFNRDGDSSLPVLNQRWAFRSDAEKLRLFQEWLKAETQLEILAGAQAATDEAYWQEFVEEGYRKGAGRAFNNTRKAALWTGAEGDFFAGTREEFLRSSFGRPVAIGKVKLLAGRVFTDLKGVTEDMNTKMTRILAEGLSQGQNPAEMARTMIKDGMGFTKKRGIQSRAMTIARTEIIRAHAEGALDAMEDLGVTKVGVMVEWSTAGDDIVCPQCAPMSGAVMTVKEMRGLIPYHPSCRCTPIPANVGESTKGQKRGKVKVQKAIDDSVRSTMPQGRKIKGEGLRFQDPETGRFTMKTSKRTLAEQKRRSSWAGADRTVAKVRPKAGVEPRRVRPVAPPKPKLKVTKVTPKAPLKPKPVDKTAELTRQLEEQKVKRIAAQRQLKSKDDEIRGLKRELSRARGRRGRVTTGKIPKARAKKLQREIENQLNSMDRFTLLEEVRRKDAIRSVAIRDPNGLAMELGLRREEAKKFAAAYSRRQDRIIMAGDRAIVPKAKIKLGGWTVGKDFGSDFRHEYGHRVLERILSRQSQSNWRTVSRKYVRKPLGQKAVSKYAATNENELFAEAFSTYTSEGYKKGLLPKDIEGFLDKHVKGGVI